MAITGRRQEYRTCHPDVSEMMLQHILLYASLNHHGTVRHFASPARQSDKACDQQDEVIPAPWLPEGGAVSRRRRFGAPPAGEEGEMINEITQLLIVGVPDGRGAAEAVAPRVADVSDIIHTLPPQAPSPRHCLFRRRGRRCRWACPFSRTSTPFAAANSSCHCKRCRCCLFRRRRRCG